MKITDREQDHFFKNVRFISIAIIVSIIVFILAAIVFIVAAFAVGLESLWNKVKMLRKPPPPPEGVECYHYRPKKHLREQAVSSVKILIRFATFPAYIFATGVGTLIGLAIYPATLLYSKSSSSGLLGLISKIFVKERDDSCHVEAEFERTTNAAMNNFLIKKYLIEMPNHVRLYTREFTPPANIEKDPTTTKHIIYFKGNGMRYEEDIESMKKDALDLNATVIGFHHSNFGGSGRCNPNGSIEPIAPSSQKELIQEGIAQVQRLIDKGVPSNLIILHGHSLGGGIATLVAWHFEQQGTPVKLYNDRSFSSISDVVKTHLLEKAPILKTLLIASIPKIIIKLLNWDLNAGDVITKLSHWDYSVVRERVSPQVVINDGVIPYGASVHKALGVQGKRKDEKQVAATPEIKNQIQHSHKFGTNRKFFEYPHNIPSSMCINKNGITAQEHFYKFANACQS